VDLSAVWLVWERAKLLYVPLAMFFNLVHVVGEALLAFWHVFFGERDSTRAPLLQFAEYPGFSLLYYLVFALRSRFTSIAAIRAKFFIMPLAFLAMGLAVHRSLLFPLSALLFIWLCAAYALFLRNNHIAGARLRDMQRQRAPASRVRVWALIVG
jgi:hypothetical protein